MDRTENQVPPGYPTENPTMGKKKKKSCWPQSKPKGERGFIEGCLFALCCCWICEMCF
ncbi:cysteine-rich and transmembrane domain-containing protein WIH1 [Coffea eugenioides]|uniref:cysteine-rich and transmembrane domain-containing protein WIH1 n=1 Tax=Coffea eugenioides TaxID=49369 RepID=UPI000F614E6C|nr:cysteine-rich and transmembrane domain-containing protein WIH1 [Coffea eugenioides]